jgi:hypothetical protein
VYETVSAMTCCPGRSSTRTCVCCFHVRARYCVCRVYP